MVNRLATVSIVILWLACMGWLVMHDVVPGWTAQDAPRFVEGEWLDKEVVQTQARIVDRHGHRIGTVWTVYTRVAENVSRKDVLWLERLPIAEIPSLRMDADSTFNQEGLLDTFELEIAGHKKEIKLLGERYGDELAFRLDIGSNMQLFKIDSSVAGMIADAFRPFPSLPDLEVGQSWRMQVINPLALVTGIGSKLSPLLVRVTGKETLVYEEEPAECYVVEAGAARAWVNEDGVVLRQTMELPLVGKMEILAEPFDNEKFIDVTSRDFGNNEIE